tara:strand:- start:10985 stop:11140 length:156 start_codon:yes stop_codon:yes gene_type:complete
MTSQEAKQHQKKAQEDPEYHFEWFFDEDGEEIKELTWKEKLYIRLKGFISK